jgi:hypothetical protein
VGNHVNRRDVARHHDKPGEAGWAPRRASGLPRAAALARRVGCPTTGLGMRTHGGG